MGLVQEVASHAGHDGGKGQLAETQYDAEYTVQSHGHGRYVCCECICG